MYVCDFLVNFSVSCGDYNYVYEGKQKLHAGFVLLFCVLVSLHICGQSVYWKSIFLFNKLGYRLQDIFVYKQYTIGSF